MRGEPTPLSDSAPSAHYHVQAGMDGLYMSNSMLGRFDTAQEAQEAVRDEAEKYVNDFPESRLEIRGNEADGKLLIVDLDHPDGLKWAIEWASCWEANCDIVDEGY